MLMPEQTSALAVESALFGSVSTDLHAAQAGVVYSAAQRNVETSILVNNEASTRIVNTPFVKTMIGMQHRSGFRHEMLRCSNFLFESIACVTNIGDAGANAGQGRD